MQPPLEASKRCVYYRAEQLSRGELSIRTTGEGVAEGWEGETGGGEKQQQEWAEGSGQEPPDNFLRPPPPPPCRHSSPRGQPGTQNHPRSPGLWSASSRDTPGLAGEGSRRGPRARARQGAGAGEAKAPDPTLTAAAPRESDPAQSPGTGPLPTCPCGPHSDFRKRHIRRPPRPLHWLVSFHSQECRAEGAGLDDGREERELGGHLGKGKQRGRRGTKELKEPMAKITFVFRIVLIFGRGFLSYSSFITLTQTTNNPSISRKDC